MSSEQKTKPKKKHSILKGLGSFIFFAALVAIGWGLHALMPKPPAGAPAAGPMAQMAGSAAPPAVAVQAVREQVVTPSNEYVGHIKPIQTADLRAQVDGYIEKVHFEEGSLVEQGQLLFTINQDRYKAQLALHQAQLSQAEANLDRAEKYLDRLQKAQQRSIIQTELDKAESDVMAFQAQVKQHQASVELAKINIDYTKIKAPISGRIGEAFTTCGNYVSPASGTLARIVQLDPIRIAFSMADRDFISLLETMQNEGAAVKTTISLPNGTVYPATGKYDFADNTMDKSTGSIAVFSKIENSRNLLIPNSYVNVSLESGKGKTMAVISQQALMHESQGAFVYVIKDDNTVEKRPVKLADAVGANQAIADGLSVGEKVVVHGLQKVRPGITVTLLDNQPQEYTKK